METGNWYRIILASGGMIVGEVRSTQVPSGRGLNDDGEHTIAVASSQVEWGLRPGDVLTYEKVELSETTEELAALKA